jgi:hypothetical protein
MGRCGNGATDDRDREQMITIPQTGCPRTILSSTAYSRTLPGRTLGMGTIFCGSDARPV